MSLTESRQRFRTGISGLMDKNSRSETMAVTLSCLLALKIPPKRQLVAPQCSRGRHYYTAPGESYQMDWGFVEVEDASGNTYKVACFAMICHCCGQQYVEFFPNAKQENLFIGMTHAFFLNP